MDSLGSVSVTDEDIEVKPKLGMEFTSESEAYAFYNAYGAKIGFGVRREYMNKSRKDNSIITSRRFVCNKEGYRKKDKRDVNVHRHRAETRTSCPARLGIVLSENGKYVCRDFIEEHNHPLLALDTFNMMRSQRRQAGGRQSLDCTQHDYCNYLPTARQRELCYGEAGSLLQYFEQQTREKPTFAYSVQLDVDEQITNVFWADPKMIIDYVHFGDVVTFDASYCSNNDGRPLCIFVGFNHHRGVVIFGAALLYNETTESFKWLFESFLKVHEQKNPSTIFTDQVDAMAKAISEVLPQTCHCLCTWRIMQNGIMKLGKLTKDGSCFWEDFRTCMYHYVEEMEFENAWQKLRTDYPIEHSLWLDSIYKEKDKWARCYMKNTLTLGMRNLQISEILNGVLKNYLTCIVDVVQFFKHFEMAVNDIRYRELQAESDARNKLPSNKYPKTPIMKQADEVYTTKIFEIFQEEYEWVGACYVKLRNENDACRKYVVAIEEQEREFEVLCNPSEKMIRCSCRKFETFGILCCHALKILDVLDIKFLPEAYVLRRWTRSAKNMVQDSQDTASEFVYLDQSQRFRILCRKLLKIASQACDVIEGYNLADSVANDLAAQLERLNTTRSLDKQLKNREGCKGGNGIPEGRRKKQCVATADSEFLNNDDATQNTTCTSLMMGAFDPSQCMIQSPCLSSSQASATTVNNVDTPIRQPPPSAPRTTNAEDFCDWL